MLTPLLMGFGWGKKELCARAYSGAMTPEEAMERLNLVNKYPSTHPDSDVVFQYCEFYKN